MEKSEAKKKAIENYVMVKDRIKQFRDIYNTTLSLESEMIDFNENYCTFKATIRHTELGIVIANGYSHEKISDNPFINATSMVENCETSAWGRALANLGMKIEKGIASKEEMRKAANKPKEYTGDKQEQQRLSSILRSIGINNSDLAKKIHNGLIENKIMNDALSITKFVKEYK